VIVASFLGVPVVLVIKLFGAGWPEFVVLSVACIAFSIVTIVAFQVIGCVNVLATVAHVCGIPPAQKE
jgi:maltodextrin utilization protein YvdJ